LRRKVLPRLRTLAAFRPPPSPPALAQPDFGALPTPSRRDRSTLTWTRRSRCPAIRSRDSQRIEPISRVGGAVGECMLCFGSLHPEETRPVMHAATISDWTIFFTAQLGAAATLGGLVFVGLSLNLTKILSFPALPNRALLALGVLLGILVVSSL